MKLLRMIVLSFALISLTGCSTVMVMYLKNYDKKRIKYKKAQRIRACLGKPYKTRRVGDAVQWLYRKSAGGRKYCVIDIYFRGGKSYYVAKKDVPANSGACAIVKKRISHCIKHYKTAKHNNGKSLVPVKHRS